MCTTERTWYSFLHSVGHWGSLSVASMQADYLSTFPLDIAAPLSAIAGRVIMMFKDLGQ